MDFTGEFFRGEFGMGERTGEGECTDGDVGSVSLGSSGEATLAVFVCSSFAEWNDASFVGCVGLGASTGAGDATPSTSESTD
jgi:hypothetical protein